MIGRYFRGLAQASTDGWNRFWFTAVDSAPLAVIRIAIGLLLVYSHVVWAFNSSSFFGGEAWLSGDAIASIQTGSYASSALWWIDGSPSMIWIVHCVAILNAGLLTIGLWSRVAAPVAFVLTVSYANRSPAALYGFDQVLGFVTLYLSVNPGHGWLSVDCWRDARRRAMCLGNHPELCGERRLMSHPSVSANIATRLLQLHLCLIYLMAGLAKLKGAAWWSGVAFWGAIANLEYQTVDLTWLVHWPVVVSLLTVSALAWEISYITLVWNRWTRPLVLAFGVMVHGGIAVCFGMMTFGLAMIVANLAFVSPMVLRSMLQLDRNSLWDAELEQTQRTRFRNEKLVATPEITGDRIETPNAQQGEYAQTAASDQSL